jgi:hypothetical protein
MGLSGANLIGSTYNGNDNSSLNTYNKLYQQQALKRAAEQKSLTEELSKVKTDGIREKDMDNYAIKHNQWKNDAIAASKERDPNKKAKLLIDAEKDHLEAQQFVNRSKAAGLNETDFTKRLLDDHFRDQFSDDAVTKAQNNKNLSIDDPKYISDYSTLGRQVDLSKVQDTFDKLDEHLLKNTIPKLEKGDRVHFGNENGTQYLYKKQVPLDQRIAARSNMYDISKPLKAYYVQKYPDIYNSLPPEQAKFAAIKADLQGSQPLESSNNQNIKWDKQEKEKETIPIQSTPSVKFTIGSKGQEVEVLNSQNFSSKSYTLGGTSAYDTDTGKDISIPSTADGVKIGQIGLYPFMINSKITKPVKGKDGKWTKETISGANRIASPDFVKDHRNLVDYREAAIGFYKDKLGGYDTNIIIPASSLPTNDKELNKRLAQLKSDKKNLDIQYNNSKQQTQSSGKIYKTKKYGNFTEEDLKAQYNDSWKEALKKLQ